MKDLASMVYLVWYGEDMIAGFSDEAKAEAYAKEAGRFFDESLLVESFALNLPRHQLPGAFCVMLDEAGNVLSEDGYGWLPDTEPSWSDRGQAPVPRFFGFGMTKPDAFAAAEFIRKRYISRVAEGKAPDGLEDPMEVACSNCGTVQTTDRILIPCKNCKLYTVTAPLWASERNRKP